MDKLNFVRDFIVCIILGHYLFYYFRRRTRALLKNNNDGGTIRSRPSGKASKYLLSPENCCRLRYTHIRVIYSVTFVCRKTLVINLKKKKYKDNINMHISLANLFELLVWLKGAILTNLQNNYFHQISGEVDNAKWRRPTDKTILISNFNIFYV